ncbi:kinase A anchor protein [Lipomyces orientalis]|uniref:Kinase A anchor protein n=1 Tax=Lipomyces orientalis TaxID=1233043 RepID=A0ACC3TWN2_9ASCO
MSRIRSPQLTHFLSIPLASPSLTASLSALRRDVLTTLPGFPIKAIRPVATIHLTLGVMALDTAGPRLKAATDALLRLADSAPDIIPDTPLQVGLRGLSMFDESTTSNANVVFANVYGDDVTRLQEFANRVSRHFIELGFVVDASVKNNENKNGDDITTPGAENEGVALHATVLNTRYASYFASGASSNEGGEPVDRKKGKKKYRKIRPSFDATELLAKFQNTVFMEPMHIDKLAICKMGERKVEDGGGYEIMAYIPLP